ncbi:type II CAAX endopeptidase family protein [Metabacillus fastidiosus]|uniref:CPBP family intramembrane glutamic endopeptidase n=1 Tax=Metabacillus fastidiosus TaxID=1458 RepID=UPI003D2B03D4
MGDNMLVEPAEQPKVKEQFNWKHLILSVLIYLAISIVLVITVAVPLIILQVVEGGDLVDKILTDGSILLLIDGLTVLIALLIYKPLRIFIRKSCDLSVLKSGKTYLYILAGLLLTWIIQYVLIDILSFENNIQQQEDLGFASVNESLLKQVLFVLAVGIVTPIKEEFLYRGILYGFLANKYHFWIGLIVSSVIFGVLHTGFPVTASLMGLIFALLYKRTGSLLPPIILHAVWNSIVVFIQIFTA